MSKEKIERAILDLKFAESRAFRMYERLYDAVHSNGEHPTNDCGIVAALLTVAAMIKDVEPSDDKL